MSVLLLYFLIPSAILLVGATDSIQFQGKWLQLVAVISMDCPNTRLHFLLSANIMLPVFLSRFCCQHLMNFKAVEMAIMSSLEGLLLHLLEKASPPLLLVSVKLLELFLIKRCFFSPHTQIKSNAYFFLYILFNLLPFYSLHSLSLSHSYSLYNIMEQ